MIDPSDISIAEFIDFIHRPAPGLVELRLIQEPKPEDKVRVLPTFHKSPAAAQAFVLERVPNLERAFTFAVHVGAAPRVDRAYVNGKAGNAEDVPAVGALWTDLDFKTYAGGEDEARARMTAFPLQPSVVVATGCGFHCYWKLSEPFVCNGQAAGPKNLMRRIAQALKSDQKVAEVARVLRLPGTLHRKDAKHPKPVRIIEWHPERIYTPGDFSFLPEEQQSQPSAAPPHRDASAHAGVTRRSASASQTKDVGAETALARAVTRVASAQENVDRNETLNRAAYFLGHFIGAGRLDQSTVETMLASAATTVGLTPGEYRPTIRSGIEDGKLKPMHSEAHPGSTSAGPAASSAVAPSPGSTPVILDRGDEVELGEHLFKRLSQPEGPPLVFDAGQLYQYDEPAGIWSPISSETKSAIIQSLAGTPVYSGTNSEGAPKTKPLKVAAKAVYGAITLAHDRAHHHDFFHNAPPGLVFTNGYLDVKASVVELLPHSPDHRARFTLPVEFVADAKPLRFYEFLDQILGSDDNSLECIRLLQEHAGATLLGIAPRYATALVLTGAGANGKSTYLQILSALFPPDSIAAIPPQLWHDDFALSHLVGKRLNVVSELPEAKIFAADTFKNIISGDLKSVRPPYARKSINFRPEAGHIFACNRLPGTDDLTEAFWRRFLVVPFERVIPLADRNPKLAAEIIEADLASIAYWAIRGAQRLMTRGFFTEPVISRAAKDEWRLNADPVARYLEERTAPAEHGGQWAAASVLFEDFKTWISKNCHRQMSSTKFGMRMKQLGLQSRRTESGRFYSVRLTAADRANSQEES